VPVLLGLVKYANFDFDLSDSKTKNYHNHMGKTNWSDFDHKINFLNQTQLLVREIPSVDQKLCINFNKLL
jgi:hypothetical protein